MKESETQISNTKKLQRHRLLAPILLAALTSSALAGSIADRIRSETGMIINPPEESMIGAMPAPRLSEDQASGDCVNTSLVFENPSAQTGWHGRYAMALGLWAIAHAGARAEIPRQCKDMVFTTQLWQSAIGNPITGKLSQRDVTEIVRIADGSNPQFAFAHQNDGMSQNDRAVDMFLGLAQQGDAKAQLEWPMSMNGREILKKLENGIRRQLIKGIVWLK